MLARRVSTLVAPRENVDIGRIEEMQNSGMSLRQIAAAPGIGYGTVRERLQSSERKIPGESSEVNVPLAGVPAGL